MKVTVQRSKSGGAHYILKLERCRFKLHPRSRLEICYDEHDSVADPHIDAEHF